MGNVFISIERYLSFIVFVVEKGRIIGLKLLFILLLACNTGWDERKDCDIIRDIEDVPRIVV